MSYSFLSTTVHILQNVTTVVKVQCCYICFKYSLDDYTDFALVQFIGHSLPQISTQQNVL